MNIANSFNSLIQFTLADSGHYNLLLDVVLHHSKGSKRRGNMRLETCTVSLPPTLGAMLATFGQLTEFRVAFGGSRGTVTLIYGDKRRKRTRGKKPCAPGAAKGEPKPAAKLPAVVPSFVPPPAQTGASREVQGGPKPVAKPPVEVPSGNQSPDSPTRTTRKGPRQKYPAYTSTPRASKTGMTLPPTAPVTAVVPVEQVAQKRKASLPLPPKTVTRPVSPPSPTCWEIAHHRRHAGRQPEAGSGGGLESTSRLPLKTSLTCRANRLRKLGRFSQMKWARLTSGCRAETNRFCRSLVS